MRTKPTTYLSTGTCRYYGDVTISMIGAIALESELLNAFVDDDVAFVGQLAIQAAVAIRNAQLYRRSQIVRDTIYIGIAKTS